MRLKKFNIEYGKTIFKSFSDVSRIRILNILSKKKEVSISDLEMILNFTQTKTSRHIYYLKNSGLLNSKNIEKFIFYSLREEALDIWVDNGIISELQWGGVYDEEDSMDW